MSHGGHVMQCITDALRDQRWMPQHSVTTEPQLTLSRSHASCHAERHFSVCIEMYNKYAAPQL